MQSFQLQLFNSCPENKQIWLLSDCDHQRLLAQTFEYYNHPAASEALSIVIALPETIGKDWAQPRNKREYVKLAHRLQHEKHYQRFAYIVGKLKVLPTLSYPMECDVDKMTCYDRMHTDYKDRLVHQTDSSKCCGAYLSNLLSD